MKGRSRDHTGTPDIAGIAGYFRLMQYNMHCLSYFFPEFFSRSFLTNLESLPSASLRFSIEYA